MGYQWMDFQLSYYNCSMFLSLNPTAAVRNQPMATSQMLQRCNFAGDLPEANDWLK